MREITKIYRVNDKYDAVVGANPPDWVDPRYARTLKLRGRDVTVFLRSLGYKFPGRHTPKRHQLETWRFLIENPRAFCLDGLGAGKTLSTLWAIDYLLAMGHIKRVLIVAPLSICEYVWGRELFVTFPWIRYKWVVGARKQKQAAVSDKRNQVLIINPDSLYMFSSIEADLFVVDEFTKFKNAKSRRYKSLRSLSKKGRLWMLSGTPAPQSPLDAYAPVRLVNPAPISFLQWRDWTMLHVSMFTWVARTNAHEVIAQHMRPAIRHPREECFDMPNISVIPYEIKLTPVQDKAIKEFKRLAAVEFSQGVITATTAAAVIGKSLQVMTGKVYGTTGNDRYEQDVDASPFYEAIEDIVEQADTPVLIFVPFKAAARGIYTHLAKAKYSVGLVTGETSAQGRSNCFDAIQKRAIKAVVAVAGTMSHGLTLTASRYIVWALPPFSFEEYDQANGRVIRPEQKSPVVIYHLIQHPLTANLFRRLQTKETLQQAVLRMIEERSE